MTFILGLTRSYSEPVIFYTHRGIHPQSGRFLFRKTTQGLKVDVCVSRGQTEEKLMKKCTSILRLLFNVLELYFVTVCP